MHDFVLSLKIAWQKHSRFMLLSTSGSDALHQPLSEIPVGTENVLDLDLMNRLFACSIAEPSFCDKLWFATLVRMIMPIC